MIALNIKPTKLALSMIEIIENTAIPLPTMVNMACKDSWYNDTLLDSVKKNERFI